MITYLIKDENEEEIMRTENKRLKTIMCDGLEKAGVKFTVEELNLIQE